MGLCVTSFVLLCGVAECQIVTCLGGEVVQVRATIDTQYLVSSNWIPSGDTVVSDDDFTEGLESAYLSGGYPTAKLVASECTYNISSHSEDYFVHTQILIMGLAYSIRAGCTEYVEFIDSGEGLTGEEGQGGSGIYCSNQPFQFISSNLTYAEDAYYFRQQADQSPEFITGPTEGPSQCSLSTSQLVNVLTKDGTARDDKFIGFAIKFRSAGHSPPNPIDSVLFALTLLPKHQATLPFLLTLCTFPKYSSLTSLPILKESWEDILARILKAAALQVSCWICRDVFIGFEVLVRFLARPYKFSKLITPRYKPDVVFCSFYGQQLKNFSLVA